MPTVFAHAAAGLALGTPLGQMPARFWVLLALSAMLPDADVLAFRLGIPYEDAWGHRGATHSAAFAAAWALAATALFFRDVPRQVPVALALFAATVSHGLLDMLTDGGLGVALLWPLRTERLFFPFRPVAVSPIGVEGFLSQRGLEVLASEAVWIGVPAAALALAGWAWARRRPAP